MLIDKFKLKHIEGEKLLVKSLEDKIIPEEKKEKKQPLDERTFKIRSRCHHHKMTNVK